MPISAERRRLYGADWPLISWRIRYERARGRCEVCGIAVNGLPSPWTGSRVVLTVMHLDHDPTNHSPNNLRAGCQRCHLIYDGALHAENASKTRDAKSGQLRMDLAERRKMEAG